MESCLNNANHSPVLLRDEIILFRCSLWNCRLVEFIFKRKFWNWHEGFWQIEWPTKTCSTVLRTLDFPFFSSFLFSIRFVLNETFFTDNGDDEPDVEVKSKVESGSNNCYWTPQTHNEPLFFFFHVTCPFFFFFAIKHDVDSAGFMKLFFQK